MKYKKIKDSKITNWIREHKKEIVLVAGTAATMIISKKLGNALFIKPDNYGFNAVGKDDGSVCLYFTETDIFGNEHRCSPKVCWGYHNILDISNGIKTTAENAAKALKKED